ncbi:unnamed protein product [Caenorhabditis bovis]|uniref:Serpentine receptor class gamma n=1 Tax=Caenorhabditis bovis TaxID=2654633 RepID=A0A8S1E4S2_9PELO|nr:unnamed protein product [Caenorhabditis bovis]
MHPAWLILHFSFGFVSWILYALVSKYIYSHRKQFNTAFIRLWSCFTVLNVLQYVSMKLYYHIPLHVPRNSTFSPYLENFPYKTPQTLLYFFAYYFIYSQRLCILLIISISFRFIVFPFSSSPIWERSYVMSSLFIFGIPIPFVVNLLFREARYHYISLVDGYVLFSSIEKHHGAAIRTVLQSNIFEIIIAILSGILKFASLACLSSNSLRRRNDRNLYLMTTVLFAMSLLKFAFINLYPVTSDCLALSCPFALLFVNPRLRKGVMSCQLMVKLGLQKEETQPSSV